jgi:hypothetical protein
MENEGPKRPALDDKWSALEGVANETDANLLVGFLESHGIPARVEDRSFHQAPAPDNDLSPISVTVPMARLTEAEAALEKRRSAFVNSPEGASSILTDQGLEEVDSSADEPKD